MNLDKLKQLAEAATPGPWEMQQKAFDNDGFPETPISALHGRAYVAVALDFGLNNPLMRDANALYIAAANPAAILELIAEVERLKVKRDFWMEDSAAAWNRCESRRKEVEALQAEVERLRVKANRYDWLRERDIDTIQRGGVFAGMTPDNVVLNGDDLDAAIDAAMGSKE